MSTTPDAPAPDAPAPDAPAPDAPAPDAAASPRDDDGRPDHAATSVGTPTLGTASLGTASPAEAGSPAVAPARRRRLLRLVATLAVAVLAVDQVTKAWAVEALTVGQRTPLVGDLLGLSLLYNPGAALSIATGMTWVLTAIAVVVVVVTVRASRRIGSRGWAFALGLLLGGAVGNLVDRFLRDPGPARGHVVDFIAYGELFVGNVADIAIVGAAGLVILLSMRGIGLDGTRERGGRHQATTGDRAQDSASAATGTSSAAPSASPSAATGTSQDTSRG